jgi:aminopeptidase
LPKGHLWRSGELTSKNNITFTPNIPTEEVFTIPHKDKINGVVTSTKPLAYGGMMIEGFKFTIKDGVITEAKAEKGEEFLNQLISVDEGARRFGEVALVPESSPIAKSKILFYNILYDENASNHLAFGSALKFNLINGEKLSDEEFFEAGGNKSAIHIDFMIGSSKTNVDAITEDGKEESLMRNGEWAFKI